MDIPSYLMGAIKGAHDAGIKYVVVQELPTTGEEGIIYLVPKSTSKTNNIYDEYMYISNNWELIGDTEADLSNYLAKDNTTAFIPNGDFNPSTKKYVDDKVSDATIQYSTMPTASSSNVGQIIQYTGTTTNDYTNGYFYECVEDNNVYSWENINVQAGGGSGQPFFNLNVDANVRLPARIYQPVAQASFNNLDSNENMTILQNIYNFYKENGWLDIGKISAGTHQYYSYPCISYTYNNNKLKLRFLIVYDSSKNEYDMEYFYNFIIEITINISNDLVTTVTQYPWCKTTLGGSYPKILSIYNTQSYTPTGDYNPATKKYVDDTSKITTYQLSGLSEYSSSSTYAVGDYVYYNNLIYKCSTAVSVAEAFDDTKWTQKTYMEYMSDTLVGTALQGNY